MKKKLFFSNFGNHSKIAVQKSSISTLFAIKKETLTHYPQKNGCFKIKFGFISFLFKKLQGSSQTLLPFDSLKKGFKVSFSKRLSSFSLNDLEEHGRSV